MVHNRQPCGKPSLHVHNCYDHTKYSTTLLGTVCVWMMYVYMIQQLLIMLMDYHCYFLKWIYQVRSIQCIYFDVNLKIQQLDRIFPTS